MTRTFAAVGTELSSSGRLGEDWSCITVSEDQNIAMMAMDDCLEKGRYDYILLLEINDGKQTIRQAHDNQARTARLSAFAPVLFARRFAPPAMVVKGIVTCLEAAGAVQTNGEISPVAGAKPVKPAKAK